MPLQATSGAVSYDAFGGGVPAVPQYIEDVFSTYLYTGNGAIQTIPNGIALGTAYGGSVWFDGSADTLNTPSSSAFAMTGDFTMECWAFPLTQTQNYPLLFHFASSSTAIQYDHDDAPNKFSFVVNDVRIAPSATQSPDAWYHIAGVRSGSTCTLYINGVSVATMTNSASLASSAVYIGGNETISSQLAYKGYLSNIRIVKGTAVYTSNFTPSTTPLTAISGTSLLTCQSPNPVADYSSNNFSITVTNAIAQNGGGPFTDATAGKGGLVWSKSRSNIENNVLLDTIRGPNNILVSNSTAAGSTSGTPYVTATTTGYSIGTSNNQINGSGLTYVSWTFRKQPKFFDVVTFTSSSAGDTTFSHNLGAVPGCVILKNTQSADGWVVYHRSVGNNAFLRLNTTAAQDPLTGSFSVTSTSVTVNASLMIDNNTYVAYLFAHNAGGFGLTGTDNVISCGSVDTGASGTSGTVNLGWEPQFVIIKRTNGAENWMQFDNMRGLGVLYAANKLNPNTSGAEQGVGADEIQISSTGLTIANVGNNAQFIYIAIRRGPMKVPTSGTSVYETGFDSATLENPTIRLSNLSYVDTAFAMRRTSPDSDWPEVGSRLNQGEYLRSSSTGAAVASTGKWRFDFQNGFGGSAWDNDSVAWCFRRAPSFFDEVCYTGTGSNATINHNLGVAPELIIVKSRSNATGWPVWCANAPSPTNGQYAAFLNATGAYADQGAPSTWGTTVSRTATTFSIGSISETNFASRTYVAYLFATCAGVSKVGSYTGNGSSQTINCGFTGGARFVLIKRTDSTGDWYVWDTARGIVAGNDPHLSLNTSSAEVTTDDTIDTNSTGFVVNQLAATNVNVTSATYIFLAIA